MRQRWCHARPRARRPARRKPLGSGIAGEIAIAAVEKVVLAPADRDLGCHRAVGSVGPSCSRRDAQAAVRASIAAFSSVTVIAVLSTCRTSPCRLAGCRCRSRREVVLPAASEARRRQLPPSKRFASAPPNELIVAVAADDSVVTHLHRIASSATLNRMRCFLGIDRVFDRRRPAGSSMPLDRESNRGRRLRKMLPIPPKWTPEPHRKTRTPADRSQ